MDKEKTQPAALDESVCEQFEAGWVAGKPDPIADLLPGRHEAHFLATLEELVHIDLEFGWKAARHSRQVAAIDQDDTLHQPRLLETYLRQFSELNQPDVLLRLIQQEYLVRHRYGDQPDVEEYRQRFPQIRSSNSTLVSRDLLPSEVRGNTVLRDTMGLARSPEIELGEFGDYHLLAELGRGGMGVVYQARQKSADRVVALKVIRRDRLSGFSSDARTKAIERFRTEAQAAARLEHDNLVTVYDVGEVDGDHYYSMRYVDGPTLAQLMEDGPLDHRRAARYLYEAALALHVAHKAGVLHRDLKPQNLMLDECQDRVMVADFGLAKLLEAPVELTQTGEVIGTPAYMSPEQAHDSAVVTPLTDIYAVGATLYQLITGRPPFHAATAVETLRQVMDEEVVPPSVLNSIIDRDLETICLKCLEKDPARRYDSAHTLADDLKRYLDRRPIHARPVGKVGQTIRWCRRHPAMASWIATATLALCVAVISLLVGYATTKSALQDAEQSNQVAQRALTESKISYAEARQTVDEFFTQVSENALLDQPGLQPLRNDLLRRALNYYRQFLKRHQEDASLRAELGTAHYRVARVTQLIGSPEQTDDSFKSAEKIQRALLEEFPKNRNHKRALATTRNAQGESLANSNRWQEALTTWLEARELRAELSGNASATAEQRFEDKRLLANTLMNLGIAYRVLAKFDDAEGILAEAQQVRQELLQTTKDTRVQRDLAMGFYNLALLAKDVDDLEFAESHLGRAVSEFTQLINDEPSNQANRRNLATCYRMLGQNRIDLASVIEMAATVQKLHEDALVMYSKAFELIQPLAFANPSVPVFQEDLAGIYLDRGILEAKLGNQDSAEKLLTEALETFEQLCNDNPTRSDWAEARSATRTALERYINE